MITQVTKEFAIGNAEDARTVDKNLFDVVINVAIDLDIEDAKVDDAVVVHLRRHKIGLLDGHGNSPMTFMAAVLLLYSFIRDGKRILLHCQEGASRSVIVAATLLDVGGVGELDVVLPQIMALRKVDNYQNALYDMAKITSPLIKEMIKKTYG